MAHVSGDDRRSWAMTRLATSRVARLGTMDAQGSVRLVPICFTVCAGRIFSAVDNKPKTTSALARLADIERSGHGTVLVDHFDEDWSTLWWVRARGPAAVHAAGDPIAVDGLAALVAKYPQYQATPPEGAVYSILIEQLTWWRAED